jgi:hypothetical protein
MAVLFRIFLVGLLVYLIFNTIASFGARTGRSRTTERKEPDNTVKRGETKPGISKEIGEYVDYEEVDDK